jgi:hypothetical protein
MDSKRFKIVDPATGAVAHGYAAVPAESAAFHGLEEYVHGRPLHELAVGESCTVRLRASNAASVYDVIRMEDCAAKCAGCGAELIAAEVRTLPPECDDKRPHCEGCYDDTLDAINSADADARERGLDAGTEG